MSVCDSSQVHLFPLTQCVWLGRPNHALLPGSQNLFILNIYFPALEHFVYTTTKTQWQSVDAKTCWTVSQFATRIPSEFPCWRSEYLILSPSLTSKMWSPGASRPSRAASESLTISWMTMFPSGVSFPPTMRRPSSSSGSSLNSSTTLASATRLDRRGVLSGVRRNKEPGGINMTASPIYQKNT